MLVLTRKVGETIRIDEYRNLAKQWQGELDISDSLADPVTRLYVIADSATQIILEMADTIERQNLVIRLAKIMAGACRTDDIINNLNGGQDG